MSSAIQRNAPDFSRERSERDVSAPEPCLTASGESEFSSGGAPSACATAVPKRYEKEIQLRPYCLQNHGLDLLGRGILERDGAMGVPLAAQGTINSKSGSRVCTQ